MRKMWLGGLAALLLSALVQAGGSPWKTKPFEKWTEKDVAEVLQTSPWSKPGVQASGAWRPVEMAPISDSTRGIVAGGSSDGSKVSEGPLNGTPGSGSKTSNTGPRPYNVFWWSSRTIRAATARLAVLKGTMTEAAAEQFVTRPRDEYEVRIQGEDMSVFQERGEKPFAAAAFLQMKKTKAKVFPSHVAFVRSADGSTVTAAVFCFPRRDAAGVPTIAPGEKEIDFYLQIGDHKLLTYFEPKQMQDIQGDDL